MCFLNRIEPSLTGVSRSRRAIIIIIIIIIITIIIVIAVEGFLVFFYTLYYPFREIRAVLPG